MPGKIIQGMIKAGVKNPLFLLDEIDKLGNDFRGDPASALLEVLDPEQNHSFADHFVEVDYDLSDVLFIATSNSMNIPPALLDRMEIIRLSGYTEDEKISIAMQYLVPKQMERNGVREGEIRIEEDAVRDIVRYYTREAGVRSLDREIAKICRKGVMAAQLAEDAQKTKTRKSKPKAIVVNAENLSDYLGVRHYDFGVAESENRVGQVTGLAWTEVGGELLTIEAVALKGKGNIVRTGKLGDVMQESITAAWSVVRSRADGLGLAADFYEKHDIHIHVPEGATPKDGPSAGIGMATALLSASPDFQDEYGYEKDAPGQANMTLATNWVGNRFGCLAFTLEMPFKDNLNLPDDDFGWNGQRSLRLGEAMLSAVLQISADLS